MSAGEGKPSQRVVSAFLISDNIDSVSPTGRYIPGVPDRSGSPKPIAIARPPSKDNLESMLSETKTPIKIIDPTYSGDEKASIKESEEVQSLKMNDAEKRRGRIYLCATCLSFFMAGWIDATLVRPSSLLSSPIHGLRHDRGR
jgi:hypothetical protein